ncbi:hypothetical protein MXD62_16645 [Frankia sp. Mgl5]|uniref:hypothetical protein n=1 Tax=Frankia sp. Mgl5 TaxID=2933793 RepID=UPI00200F0A6F|nr:hypothetical protein [Frankia sp. Mgl5]MCK9928785.1 hypothetical protein [Frankia sp. Mgl5]
MPHPAPTRYSWLAEDYLRHWATMLTSPRLWDALLAVVLALVSGALPTVEIGRAALHAGQTPPHAAGTAAAGILLAAAAAREVHVRRVAGARWTRPAVLLAVPLALGAACALATTGPAGPPSWWVSVLALWPALAVAGALACRLTRPSSPSAAAEPTLSRDESNLEPPAQTDEPQGAGTKTARLLALAAKLPDDDPRGPTERAAALAAQVGMHAATARRILAGTQRRPEPTHAAGSPPAQTGTTS